MVSSLWCMALSLLALSLADPPADHIKVHSISPGHTDHKEGSGETAPNEDSGIYTGDNTTASLPILYHGGPVMVTPNLHLIFFGNWGATPDSTNNGQTIILNFANALGGSPWSQIMTTTAKFPAYNSGSQTVTGRLGAIYNADVGTRPHVSSTTNLGSGDVFTIVQYYVQNNRGNVWDANAIYLVLSSSGVTQTNSASSKFCTNYCGWHSYETYLNQNIKYGWVGNAAVKCPTACGVQAIGPNGNSGVDSLISVLAHEITEATTDPLLNAWYDSSGSEDADKCAWTFGNAQYKVANGAWANMQLGTRNFLVQRNLARDSKCYINGATLHQ